MKLLSVNVGKPCEISYNGQTILTGIFKEAVTGQVRVGRIHLADDGQADLTVHGGQHKAIYVYPHEHYAYWQEQLQREDFSYGQFGENFTVEGMLEDAVHIGDQFRIGRSVVQVSQPREPCFKLGLRMGQADFPKQFLASGRVGFYLRVLSEGEVEAGQTFEGVRSDPAGISIKEAWTLMYFDKYNVASIRRLLAVEALAPQWRRSFEKRLGQTT